MRDARLRPFIARARIDCDLFQFKCPLAWGALARVNRPVGVDFAEPPVRHCNVCDRDVYLVTNDQELIDRAARGHCIAVIRPEEVPDPATVPYGRTDDYDDNVEADLEDDYVYEMGIPAR